MGFFGNVARSVREGQERARAEAESIVAKMNYSDAMGAARILLKENSSASTAKRAYMLKGFKQKIRMTSDNDELYRAFEDMYVQYKQRGKSTAMSIAQIIGRVLANRNDYRIEEKHSDDGTTLYVPSNDYF